MIYVLLTLLNFGLVVLNLWVANYLTACVCAAAIGWCAALGIMATGCI